MAGKSKGNELRTQMGCLKIDGKIYPLYEGLNTIGRNKDATVTVRDTSVSQQHAIITIVDENQQFVSDLNSCNGTIIENNKLHPLILYQLPLETVIHFAKCNALYKKVSSNSQSHNYNSRNTQETQNLHDSFYTAETQDLASNSTKANSTFFEGPTNYFEDDYNFADIPSPPLQETNHKNLGKSKLSIHEMPTQLYCSDVANDVVIGDSEIQISSKIGYDVITTKAGIHELPTQLICGDAAQEIQSSSIHDMPTQIIDKIFHSNENCADASDANTEVDTGNNKSIQLVNKDPDYKTPCKDTLDDSKANNNGTTENMPDISLDVIEASRLDDSGLNITIPPIQSHESIEEILEDTPASSLESNLHVSQLHRRTLKPIADDSEEDDSKSETVKEKEKSKSFSESKTADDSDDSITDIEDFEDSPQPSTSNSTRKTKKQTHNKPNKNITCKNSSDSDTDIEKFEIRDKSSTLQNEGNTKPVILIVNNNETNNSDSDTDDFEFGIKKTKKKVTQNLNDLSTLNESEIIPPTQLSQDDSDDDYNFIPDSSSTIVSKHNSDLTKGRIFDVSQKLKELRRTSVIPLNCSEESLHLRLSESSESLKHHGDQIADNKSDEDNDRTPDISDNDEPIINKPAEQHNIAEKVNESPDVFAIATQKITDEIPIQTEKNEGIFAKPMSSKCFSNIKRNESQNAKYSQDSEDDLFMQPTQPMVSNNNLAKENMANNDDIFMQPTQKYDLDNANVESTAIDSDANGDDVFMQATQKIVLSNAAVPPAMSDKTQPDDDVFMQSTQKIQAKSSDHSDLFVQSTQLIVVSESEVDNNKAKEDDIFMQSTQQIIVEATPPSLHKKLTVASVENRCKEDTFMQPTQKIQAKSSHRSDLFDQPTQLIGVSESEVDNSKAKEDDIVMQSTQQIIVEATPPSLHKNITIASVENQSKEDTFMQPTQMFPVKSSTVTKSVEVSEPTADNIKCNNDDLFMQETQQLILADVSSDKPSPSREDKFMETPQKYLLSLRKDPTKRTKFDDVESQLEVMFASQTLRMSSETSSRPSNPLANVLDGKPIDNMNSNDEVNEASIKDDVKSGVNNSLDDFKEYCEMPTLPMDEISDFKVSSDKIEEKSCNITKHRGQPKNDTTSSPPQKTDMSDTPRKRGRPSKNQVSKTISAVTNIADNSRNLRRTRMTIVDEKPIADKVTKSEQCIGNVSEIEKKRLLSLEPIPSTSSSCVSKEIKDENVFKRSDGREIKNKDNEICAKMDEDTEVKTIQKNSKPEIGTNLNRQLRSNRTIRVNNPDENNSKNSNKIKDKHDDASVTSLENIEINSSKSTISVSESPSTSDIQNSEKEDDRIEIMTNRTRTQTKRNLNQSLKVSKRTRRNNMVEEPEGKTKETNIGDTYKRAIRGNKQDNNSNRSIETKNVIVEENQKLKSNYVDDVVHIISDDTSASDSDKSNIASPMVKHRKVTNIQVKETTQKSQLPGKIILPTSSKTDLNIGKHMQTRKKTTNLETTTDANPTSSNNSSLGIGSKRSKRALSKDSNISKAKPLKKMKNNSENEDIESTSDTTSEFNFQSPTKSTSNLNITSSTPDRNRRIQKPKVVFTMLNSPELESLVRRLGGMVVDTVNTCTVLVTGSLKRSQKLLSAVGEGKPICSPTWLNECKKANKFLDAWDYILEDQEAETKWKFTLKESLNRSRNKKLLEDFTIVLAVSEAVDVLRAAIESSGGKCVMRVPPKNMENNLVVVANPNKKATYSKYLKQKPPTRVVAPEAIFDGVLRQEMHWEDHILS